MSNNSDREQYDQGAENVSKENRLLFSGALGISVVAVIQLLQLSSFDTALVVSLICFAISIPLTAMSVYVSTLEIDNKEAANSNWFMGFSALGLGATLGGLISLFFHFACYVDHLGWIFVGACAVAITLGLILGNSIRTRSSIGSTPRNRGRGMS